jgi:hypothetical protein
MAGKPDATYFYSSLLTLLRYVVVFVEAIAVIVTSSVWPILSFTHTNLVERNGTLTLIIIGEGIVGLAQSVSTIASGCTKVTREDIGIIIAGFLLLVKFMVNLPPGTLTNQLCSTSYGCSILIRLSMRC